MGCALTIAEFEDEQVERHLGGRAAALEGGVDLEQAAVRGFELRDAEAARRRYAERTPPVARAVDGEANYITASICKMTGNKPASVCAAAPITAIESRL